MNPAAALSRSASGKHLSFRSNLQGVNYHGSASAPAAVSRSPRRFSESSAFGSRLYADECESNFFLSEEKFGFDYAKERLEKRQLFLRSYSLTTEAQDVSNSSSGTLSRKVGGCFFKIKAALWMVISCNPPPADGHNGFVRIRRHGNSSSSRFCEQSW